MYPSLAEHACNSSGTRRFGDVIDGALLPHVAEHLAIDILVRGSRRAGAATLFSGNSSWYDEERTIMIVSVSSREPQVAQGALEAAVGVINGLEKLEN
jgi:hypothetical protein